MTTTETIAGSRLVVRLTRGILWVFLALAALIGIWILIAGLADVATTLSSGHTSLTMVVDQALPASTGSGTASVVSGDYESANVVVGHTTGAVVALAVTASITGTLTQVAIALAVGTLAWRLLRRRVFRTSITVTVAGAGAALLIGGMISQAASGLAAGVAATELNGGDGRGFWPIAGRFDPTLMAVGAVLLLVSLAFEYGERLQRDTEGLV